MMALLAQATGPSLNGAAPAPPLRKHLWDDGAALAPRARGDLEERLRSARRQTAIPISILVVAKLRHGESMGDFARRAFEDRGLGSESGDAVLLVVAPHDRQAAIETGKGPAGIVPEIDADAITAPLRLRARSSLLAPALGTAIDRIVLSVTATAERRQPLPPEPGRTGEPARGVGGPPGGPGPDRNAGAAPAAADLVDAPAAPAPPSRGRSMLPTAVAASGLLVVALALRQRRKATSERDTSSKAPPP
jgi:uncharacterized membrane protein YgcG